MGANAMDLPRLRAEVPGALRRADSRSTPQEGHQGHALFAASSHAIKALVHDPCFLGADCAGFFGVLPHPTAAVSPAYPLRSAGRALASKDGAWYASSPSFFLPVTLRWLSPIEVEENSVSFSHKKPLV